MATDTAPASKIRVRHRLVLASFLVLVMAPIGVSAWYLWYRAADQFASTVAFSVRQEKMRSAIELLGGITDLSGSGASDADILYEFIQSQTDQNRKNIGEVTEADRLRQIDDLNAMIADKDRAVAFLRRNNMFDALERSLSIE